MTDSKLDNATPSKRICILSTWQYDRDFARAQYLTIRDAARKLDESVVIDEQFWEDEERNPRRDGAVTWKASDYALCVVSTTW